VFASVIIILEKLQILIKLVGKLLFHLGGVCILIRYCGVGL